MEIIVLLWWMLLETGRQQQESRTCKMTDDVVFGRYCSASTEHGTVVSFVMRSILTLLSDAMSRDSGSNNGSQ